MTVSLICVVSLLSVTLLSAVNSQGDAEFWRKRNMIPFELERTMDIDFLKTRNYQSYELLRNMSIDLLKLRNYESFELTRTMDVDVTKQRNYQVIDLIRTMDIDVTKPRNYMAFRMLDTGELGLVIDVGPVLTTDQNGEVADDFYRGNVVQFEFVLENIGNTTLTNGLISTQVLDPAGTPIFLNYFYETLTPGAHANYIVGYVIPEGGSTGTYTVRVMAFTDWPSQGIGLDIETSTFNVIA